MMKKKIAIGLIVIAFTLTMGYFSRDYLNPENEVAFSQNEPFFDDSNLDQGGPDKCYLFDTNTNEGVGLAKRAFSMGEYIHTVNIDLPALGEGQSYVGWLIKGESENEAKIETGKLTRLNNEFFLIFESREDLSNYSKVVITKRADDSTEYEMIAEGNF